MRTTLKNGASFWGETVNYCMDGSSYELEWEILLVKDERGQTTHFLSTQQDIAERQRAEQQIWRAKQEWIETVDAVSDMIILEHTEGNLRRCNKATADYFDLSYLELIEKPVSLLFRKTEFGDFSSRNYFQEHVGALKLSSFCGCRPHHMCNQFAKPSAQSFSPALIDLIYRIDNLRLSGRLFGFRLPVLVCVVGTSKTFIF